MVRAGGRRRRESLPLPALRLPAGRRVRGFGVTAVRRAQIWATQAGSTVTGPVSASAAAAAPGALLCTHGFPSSAMPNATTTPGDDATTDGSPRNVAPLGGDGIDQPTPAT